MISWWVYLLLFGFDTIQSLLRNIWSHGIYMKNNKNKTKINVPDVHHKYYPEGISHVYINKVLSLI